MCGFVCYREVVQAGSAVTSLKEGDRVALEPGIPCWSHKMSRQDAASGDTKKRDANSALSCSLTKPHHDSAVSMQLLVLMGDAQHYTGVRRTIQLYMSKLNFAIQSALLMQKLLSKHYPISQSCMR